MGRFRGDDGGAVSRPRPAVSLAHDIPPIRHPVRILGIDPGLRRTGWGVIEIDGNRLAFIGCGSVEPPERSAAGEPPARDP